MAYRTNQIQKVIDNAGNTYRMKIKMVSGENNTQTNYMGITKDEAKKIQKLLKKDL